MSLRLHSRFWAKLWLHRRETEIKRVSGGLSGFHVVNFSVLVDA
jgi:hypothetical protein